MGASKSLSPLPIPDSPLPVFISLLGDYWTPGCFSNIHKEE